MTSATLSETNTNCKLDFWYYMTGTNVGSVSVVTAQAGQNRTVWYVSGSQGPKWTKAEMILGAGSDYNVRAELKFVCILGFAIYALPTSSLNSDTYSIKKKSSVKLVLQNHLSIYIEQD